MNQLIKISEKENKALIHFHAKLYYVSAIETAILDFKEIADGSVALKGDYIITELKPKSGKDNKKGKRKRSEENETVKENINRIALEFCNYVLGVMKNETFV